MSILTTLMSYNVHEAVGTDHQRDYRRISDVIGEINPDIINLQEVDSDLSKPGKPQSFLFETINQMTNYQGIRGVTMFRSRSAYGNAIFLRSKSFDIKRHDISFEDREPRGILECKSQINNITLRILNTHFGLKKRERRAQVSTLKQLVQEDITHPILISGDFNEWYPHSKNLSELELIMNIAPKKRTFPARFPIFKLDRIFYRGRIRLIDTWIHQSLLSRAASDHLPLVAKFDISA
jgi:endonuclease/exonuclease/phosphatase family metal-dependent hydrolase